MNNLFDDFKPVAPNMSFDIKQYDDKYTLEHIKDLVGCLSRNLESPVFDGMRNRFTGDKDLEFYCGALTAYGVMINLLDNALRSGESMGMLLAIASAIFAMNAEIAVKKAQGLPTKEEQKKHE